MTKIIGLTGGIGSGKTTIAKLFKDAGIPIYIADDEARVIMQALEIIAAIQQSFGMAIFENGILNRKKLSEIVFNSPGKLKELNAIIHPAVKSHFQNWVFNLKNEPYVIYESAILFESGSSANCDLIITVVAPLETRIQRVVTRDKTKPDLVLKRINAQWSDEQRKEKSDFIIENVHLESTQTQVRNILKILNNY